ncbi:hypothetical protein OH807_23340 [Kitasatospora sp. NBC_01560]|uniref:hypothetical protein n=1 Tax=Kitasatospora sp. NBC_01560 TaxID=2975965 RepID=UPI003864AFE1
MAASGRAARWRAARALEGGGVILQLLALHPAADAGYLGAEVLHLVLDLLAGALGVLRLAGVQDPNQLVRVDVQLCAPPEAAR